MPSSSGGTNRSSRSSGRASPSSHSSSERVASSTARPRREQRPGAERRREGDSAQRPDAPRQAPGLGLPRLPSLLQARRTHVREGARRLRAGGPGHIGRQLRLPRVPTPLPPCGPHVREDVRRQALWQAPQDGRILVKGAFGSCARGRGRGRAGLAGCLNGSDLHDGRGGPLAGRGARLAVARVARATRIGAEVRPAVTSMLGVEVCAGAARSRLIPAALGMMREASDCGEVQPSIGFIRFQSPKPPPAVKKELAVFDHRAPPGILGAAVRAARSDGRPVSESQDSYERHT